MSIDGSMTASIKSNSTAQAESVVANLPGTSAVTVPGDSKGLTSSKFAQRPTSGKNDSCTVRWQLFHALSAAIVSLQ